jgi:hypothetical protein
MMESRPAPSCPHPLLAISALVTMQPVAEVDVNARSHCCSDSHCSSINPIEMSISGYKEASSSARARPRFSSFT